MSATHAPHSTAHDSNNNNGDSHDDSGHNAANALA